MNVAKNNSQPSLLLALIPVVILISLLTVSVSLFKDQSSSGPNQLSLMLAAGITILIGLRQGLTWKELEKSIGAGIASSINAILILLIVGALIGSWILAGIVPSMIYYGVSIINPHLFYGTACIICAIIALATGSSWITAGTIGTALIGIAAAQDLHLGLAAGAIISGSYFGDKMSPLSDTTNLASATGDVEIFTHIQHMIWTTAPSFLIAVLLFFSIGQFLPVPTGINELDDLLFALTEHFTIGPHLLIPIFIVTGLVIKKIPAFLALLYGALIGGIFAALFQQALLVKSFETNSFLFAFALVKEIVTALYAGVTLDSGNQMLDELLSRGGMSSMIMPVWLIISAMTFGAVMETTGMLEVIFRRIIKNIRSTGDLIASTAACAIGINVITSDQYIAIVLPGRIFRDVYRRQLLEPKNLSRTLEDAGTLTSVLIPWNTCGVFMAQTLGVSTLTYAPFAFFNLVCPVVATAFGYNNIGITKLPSTQQKVSTKNKSRSN